MIYLSEIFWLTFVKSKKHKQNKQNNGNLTITQIKEKLRNERDERIKEVERKYYGIRADKEKQIIYQEYKKEIENLNEGVTLDISNNRNIDKISNGDKIKNYHRQRLARISGRIRLLHRKLNQCDNLMCKKVVFSQIKKWKFKYNQELGKKPDSMTMKPY
jgi:hypothetical protein